MCAGKVLYENGEFYIGEKPEYIYPPLCAAADDSHRKHEKKQDDDRAVHRNGQIPHGGRRYEKHCRHRNGSDSHMEQMLLEKVKAVTVLPFGICRTAER